MNGWKADVNLSTQSGIHVLALSSASCLEVAVLATRRRRHWSQQQKKTTRQHSNSQGCFFTKHWLFRHGTKNGSSFRSLTAEPMCMVKYDLTTYVARLDATLEVMNIFMPLPCRIHVTTCESFLNLSTTYGNIRHKMLLHYTCANC